MVLFIPTQNTPAGTVNVSLSTKDAKQAWESPREHARAAKEGQHAHTIARNQARL